MTKRQLGDHRRYSGAQHAELGDIIERWSAAQRRRGLAEDTIRRRAELLRHWWYFTEFKALTVRSWRTVETFTGTGGRAAKTCYAEVSHLHQFYRWAMREGLTRHDPTVLVERPRLGSSLPRPIHDTDLAIALALSTGPVHTAIVLCATSGLRCIEVARLRWIDVGDRWLRLEGKGRKERVVPLHPDGVAALEQLDRVDEWVFPWRLDRYNTAQRTILAINRFLRSIGVSATAHQLRHWFATTALTESGDLRAVQELMGHASPTTTAIYTKLDPSRLAPIVDAITLPVGLADRGQGSEVGEVFVRSAP